MKTAVVLSLMIALARSAVDGQTWTPQLGIAGGVSRQKPAGTGQHDEIDRWELPNSGSLQPALFVILPLSGRVGLESSLGAMRAKFSESSGLIPTSTSTDIRLTVRADFAVTANVYIAAGGMLRRRELNSGHSTQTGAVGAFGYHRGIGAGLDARLEAEWITQRRTGSIGPSNVYALLFGLSHPFRSQGERAVSDAPTFRPWRLQLGAAGGYARNHLYGTALGVYFDAHETDITVPGSGATTPPPLFLDAPLVGRLALEIGLGGQRIQQRGTTLFDGHIAPRLNVAIYRGLYAGAGGNLQYVEQSGSKGIGFAGANVGAGYRFSIVQPFEGRVDITYTMFKEREDFPLAQNTIAVLLGVAMVLR